MSKLLLFYFVFLKSLITEDLSPFLISPALTYQLVYLWSCQGLALLDMEEASRNFSQKPPLSFLKLTTAAQGGLGMGSMRRNELLEVRGASGWLRGSSDPL